jgi:predicted O-methyltransferase YrrM
MQNSDAGAGMDGTRVRPIRPWQLFAALRADVDDRTIQVSVPLHHGAGGLTLLETTVLLCAARIVEARRIFEFGTFRGSTTLNFALNVPEDGAVFTFDLDAQSASELEQEAADVPITKLHFDQERLDFERSRHAGKVTQLFGNSRHYDFSPWYGTMDFVFIDGGHDVATAAADSENALKLIRRDKPSAILWHDYRNADYGPLGGYLESLSRKIEMHHIEDTMLCVHFSDPGIRSGIA